jgi:hypothetical protein
MTFFLILKHSWLNTKAAVNLKSDFLAELPYLNLLSKILRSLSQSNQSPLLLNTQNRQITLPGIL